MRMTLLALGALGAMYTVYLLLFRRDWPERRRDDRRWRSDRRENESPAAALESTPKRRESDRREYQRRGPDLD